MDRSNRRTKSVSPREEGVSIMSSSGQRNPRGGVARRRVQFRPIGEPLEQRIALSIDLATVDTKPYGIQETNGFVSNTAGAGARLQVVSDIANTGYQDLAIGAPSFTNTSTGPSVGQSGTSAAYLLFGSNGAGLSGNGSFPWADLKSNSRVSDLSTLGQVSQTNPKTGLATFPYNGLTFITSSNLSSGLGSSIADVPNITGTGINAFMLGAPNGLDANSDPGSAGTGRAYLIYGGTALQKLVPAKSGLTTLDLDSNAPPTGQNVIVFWSSQQGIGLGTAVANVGNLLGDGGPDIAISAPNASYGGMTNNGAIYVIPASFLRTVRNGVINVDEIGQTGKGAIPGVVFIGANNGDRIGQSLANAGNTDGSTAGGLGLSDMLIGASNADSGFGAAYLVYGASNLTSKATQDTNGIFDISLSRLGTPGSATGVIKGAVFDGTTQGDMTGYSVSGAGTFDGGTLSDFLIGSPGYNGSAGLATLVFGRSASSPSGAITGTFTINSLPGSVKSLQMIGPAAGALAGYSVSATRSVITNYTLPDIIIGAPGANNGEGSAYLIPGSSTIVGTHHLQNTESGPLQGLIITASNSASTPYLGTAVSGNLTTTPLGNTLDLGGLGSVAIGAPGYSLTGQLAGGSVFALQGRYIPLSKPKSTEIPVTIGVNSPFGPFTVNASSSTMTIYVFSNANITPPFVPPTEINPTSIVVNGVAYPNATITTDPKDENGDGYADAIITISPVSALNLVNGTTTITISGTTLSTSAHPNELFSGSATVTVTGSTNSGGGAAGVPGTVSLGSVFSTFPQYGDSLVPSVQALSQFNWRPLPIRIAYSQFQAPAGFVRRIYLLHHPGAMKPFGSRYYDRKQGKNTLPQSVFTHREQFHNGKLYTYRHPGIVIPSTMQYGSYFNP